MSISEEAAKHASEKVKWILESQCRIPVRSTTPIIFYYNKSSDLVEEADYYYRNQQFEQSFILYSRYIM